MTIYEEFISLACGDSVYDVLSTFENLFKNLGIYLEDYNYLIEGIDPTDEDEVYTAFKKILIKAAMDNEIISSTLDVNNDFKTEYGYFGINSHSVDEDLIESIQSDFKDWTGIELDII